jgi:AMMECR1 domain-containing protein
MVTYGGRRGLLLPQVAPEWGWDRETFLAQTCHKAGLPPSVLKSGAKLEAFTAEVFGESEPGESLRD